MKSLYYIDESGTLNNSVSGKDRFFILGCCITDNPEAIHSRLETLKSSIASEPFMAKKRADFLTLGFHASKNKYVIQDKYYGVLYSLDFRYYCIIVDKTDSKYSELISKGKSAYYELLHHLLFKRVLSNRSVKNTLIFETYGSIGNHLKRCNDVVAKIADSTVGGVDYTVEVHKKEDIILSIVDYTNYLVFRMLLEIPTVQMCENFELLQPKIGLIHNLFAKKFYSRSKKVNFDEIKSGNSK